MVDPLGYELDCKKDSMFKQPENFKDMEKNKQALISCKSPT